MGAWLGWALAGLEIFAGDHPPLVSVQAEAQRFAVVLAMVRARGCLARAHRLTGLGRSQIPGWLRG